MAGKKVVMIIAPKDFRDPEYFVPKSVLEKAGVTVLTASNTDMAVGAEGGRVKTDMKVADVGPNYDGVVFIGGIGASCYFNDPVAQKLAQTYNKAGKVVAAICIAPSTIANAGVLKGKKATSFPSQSFNLASKGAQVVNAPVVVDGKIVTANGPAAAEEFGKKILAALS